MCSNIIVATGFNLRRYNYICRSIQDDRDNFITLEQG